MHNAVLKCRILRSLCNCMIDKQLNRYYSDNVKNILEKQKIIHPYRKLHPWKSQESFSKYLLKNVLYNKDGLVAINKPYGISAKTPIITKENNLNIRTVVPNSVDYTLDSSTKFIAKELGYSELIIVKAPEKFMSGVTLLAANDTVQKAINYSYVKSIGMNVLNKTYWIVTVRVPNQIKGSENLCMKQEFNSSRSQKKIIIEEKWSKNMKKQRKIKILNIQFKVISNSTNNLSSLIEVKSSTIKWHALRLFASIRLYTPILGDNVYGSRIHNIGGKWLLVNPFAEVNNYLPTINPELLEMLYLSKAKQELIPCHIHARSIFLPNIWENESVTIEAPLIPPFDWTCKQLQFKNIPEFEESKECEVSMQA